MLASQAKYSGADFAKHAPAASGTRSEILRGVYPERQGGILRGVYPERSERAQNDSERAQNDKRGQGLSQFLEAAAGRSRSSLRILSKSSGRPRARSSRKFANLVSQ